MSKSELESLQQECERLAAELVQLCSERNLTVATAESLTAGMVSSTIAAVPGASSVLNGAAVTYTNAVKERLLGVSEDTIARVTEVSAEVALQMAQGAADLFVSDLAASLTGYAGPGGGTADNPVGTVYLGLVSPNCSSTRHCRFDGDRQIVRVKATREALSWLLESAQAVSLA